MIAEASLRIVIADDDEPIRNMLCNFFCSIFKEVEVVCLAADGEELLEVVRRTVPDGVFVDIQMPGLDGLSAVHILQKEFPTLFVVFISAHTHYAIEAFNLDATDFLSKPINIDRLGKALAKIKRFKALTAANHNEHNFEKQNATSNSSYNLILKHGHGITVIDKRTIFYVEKQGIKCIFHTARGIYETICSLISLENYLKEPDFFRCHKCFIINVSQVEKVEPYADRAYDIIFYDYPNKVSMRKEKFDRFCDLIKYCSTV